MMGHLPTRLGFPASVWCSVFAAGFCLLSSGIPFHNSSSLPPGYWILRTPLLLLWLSPKSVLQIEHLVHQMMIFIVYGDEC